MLFDESVDDKLRRFEHDVLHKPGRARKTLSQWAGSVWYQDRYGERYGVVTPESAETAMTRQRLLSVIAARLPYVAPTRRCIGRSCECRYLRLALSAFDRERLAMIRRRRLTTSSTAVSSVFAAFALILAFWFLGNANTLPSDRAFGFIAGISGGLVVATIQMIFAITTLLTDRVAETVEWRWYHPDSDWQLLGLLNPRHRRRLRHAHLRRAASVVLGPVARESANPTPAPGFVARLSRAYRAFKAGSEPS
ncbi:hypothetical protein BJY16_003858 [Actinoplanes octamycinicus]|uniref:Uncharacterized protein n=1 Tax=Actinoplanes octamycinicus TaxID=135948 RepID=A0A7W7GY15_9ACTN|nr:hypothetical protein [Actinoplanes octamycinicus]MBB4740399.1 hypothetical protein [Actinoplanes octamycinicus]GIE59660.1 hypothetical protein Aoc01nite_50620 [Actinoplanes octamycinicus]